MDGYVYFFSIIGFVVLFWTAMLVPLIWMTFHYLKGGKK